MSAPVSPHGFETVRGRGYRPEDVDRRVAELSTDRDACWERAARLTVLANEMDAELGQLREQVAKLPPQTHESLGEQARLLLTTAESEAARLRSEAQEAAEQIRDEAMKYADRIRDEAEAASRKLRTEAEESGRRTEEAARAKAAPLVAAAEVEGEQWRAEAAEALEDVRRRADKLWREQEKRQAEKSEAAARELAGLEAETDRLVAELDAQGEARLTDRRRTHAAAEEAARHTEEDAVDRARAVAAQAKVEAERIQRDTERLLREHEEEREEMRAHMAHVRNSLAALTGKDPEEVEEEAPAPEPEPQPVDQGEGAPVEAAGPEREDRDPDGCDPDNEDTLETELPRLEG